MNEKSCVNDQKKGELMVHHSNSASSDRKFRPLVTANQMPYLNAVFCNSASYLTLTSPRPFFPRTITIC